MCKELPELLPELVVRNSLNVLRIRNITVVKEDES